MRKRFVITSGDKFLRRDGELDSDVTKAHTFVDYELMQRKLKQYKDILKANYQIEEICKS